MKTCLSILLLLGVASSSSGAVLQWNPNKENNIAGYKVYWRTNPGCYHLMVDVGKTNTYTLPNLLETVTYYIVVTAYNTNGLESKPSDELVFYADDGVPSYRDNCPRHYNPRQEDTYPPGGNQLGDVCDCEADFDCNGKVDSKDALAFYSNFGRNIFLNPCTQRNTCQGDFNCDGNVDSKDANVLLEDFGRSAFNNPCPACQAGTWCSY